MLHVHASSKFWQQHTCSCTCVYMYIHVHVHMYICMYCVVNCLTLLQSPSQRQELQVRRSYILTMPLSSHVRNSWGEPGMVATYMEREGGYTEQRVIVKMYTWKTLSWWGQTSQQSLDNTYTYMYDCSISNTTYMCTCTYTVCTCMHKGTCTCTFVYVHC